MNEANRTRYEPLSWLLVFLSRSTLPAVNRFVPGRFKHVMAAGWVEASKVWLVYDVHFARTQVMALPDPEGGEYVARYVADDPWHGILRMTAAADGGGVLRWGFWCVPAVKHLVGLGCGALRPDALWRHCIAAGAEIVHEQPAKPAALSAVSAGDRRAEGGRAGQDALAAGHVAGAD